MFFATKGGQPCISCGKFITTLGRKGIIYTFGKTMFTIRNFLAHVKNAEQNLTPEFSPDRTGINKNPVTFFSLEATYLKLYMCLAQKIC